MSSSIFTILNLRNFAVNARKESECFLTLEGTVGVISSDLSFIVMSESRQCPLIFWLGVPSKRGNRFAKISHFSLQLKVHKNTKVNINPDTTQSVFSGICLTRYNSIRNSRFTRIPKSISTRIWLSMYS